MTPMNLSTRQKQNQGYREQIGSCQGGEKGRGLDWEFGMSRCKLVYTEWINIKVLLCSTGNYTQYSVIDHNGKEYEKHVYVWITESLCYTADINTTL